MPCRLLVLEGLPPDGSSVLQLAEEDTNEGMQPTLESTNVSAIAVTGAPSRFPISVVLPSSWAKDAVKASAATFPQ